MKINPSSANHIYLNNQKAGEKRPAQLEQDLKQKQDSVQLSPEALRRQSVEGLEKKLAQEVHAPASQGRLEALKAQINNNQYRISNEDLADAILAPGSRMNLKA